LYARTHHRRRHWELLGGAVCGMVVWLAFELAVVALGDGVGMAVATSGWLLASAEVLALLSCCWSASSTCRWGERRRSTGSVASFSLAASQAARCSSRAGRSRACLP